MEINDVLIVGIWGMGGVGKTTIARAIFDTLSPQFQGASFLADVKETNTNEMHSLQNILLSELLRKDKRYVNNKEDGKRLIAHRLRFMKVLIVLDDINHHDHWENLAGDLHWFGSGSMIQFKLHGLIEKSLVFISKYDTIQMHDLIQDMGRYVVKTQKDSGKPTRLWNVEDFEKVMANNTDTKAMEAIWFSYCQQLCFSKEAMTNMDMLRILHIYRKDETMSLNKQLQDYHDDSIEYLPNSLCWFVWNYYPWESLPENFVPKCLVHFDLRWSLLRHLWTGMESLPSLRKLNLSGSKSLMRTPDVTKMPNLEYLNLEGCSNLEEVHHSLGCSRKLIQLYLTCCKCLKRFPCVNVESLKFLDLQDCSSLEEFPEILGIMKPELVILMAYSGIRGLPSCIIQHQAHLTELDLSSMQNLVALTSSICKLKGLVKLDVSYCSKLESFPEEIGDLENLENLDARGTLISQPPSSIVQLKKLKFLSFAKQNSGGGLVDGVYFVFPQVNEGLRSLEHLNLSYCNLIDGGLLEDIGCLSSLKELYLQRNNFEHLPLSIAQLGSLRVLDLSECRRLKEFLGVDMAEGLCSLVILNLSFCNLIDGGLPEDIGCLSSLKKFNLSGNNFEHLPQSIAQLGALRSLDLSYCQRLKEFLGVNMAEGLHSLEILNLSFCNLIDGGLPEDIGCLSSLKELHLQGNNFEHLPRSIAQLGALQTLHLPDCKRLTQLPELTQIVKWL